MAVVFAQKLCYTDSKDFLSQNKEKRRAYGQTDLLCLVRRGNPSDGQTCLKCGKKLDAKEHPLVDYLVAHTKDKLKGDIEDGLYDALKNYLLSHLYSVIIAVAFVVTAVAAVVTAATPHPGDGTEQITVYLVKE